jgi:hypothetical protein
LESAKASHGLLKEDVEPDGLLHLSQALQKSEKSPSEAAAAEISGVESADSQSASDSDAPDASADGGGAGVRAQTAPGTSSFNSAGLARLITLPRLSATEIDELVAAIQLKLETEHGYRLAQADEAGSLPPGPSGLSTGPILSERVPNGH